MDFMILNKEFQNYAVVDTYESAIWTDRYSECGDFELYFPASSYAWLMFEQDYYLWTKDSEHLMIIEGKELSSDVEQGNKLIVTGRSLESILERRIIRKQTNYTGNLQDEIEQMLTDCIIDPETDNGQSDTKRKISNFKFEENDDPALDAISIDLQCTGDNLYTVITNLCTAYDLGFKITLRLIDNVWTFVFRLYFGEDRSYDQEDNPFVVFSPNFDNIINSNYIENSSSYKNVVYVGGEGEDEERKIVIVPDSDAAEGLDRREIFQDARNIRGATDNQLKEEGKKVLSENQIVKAFEGETETTQMFIYGRDFYLGDIVQLVNEYGVEAKTRVTEMVMSQDDLGYSAHPTFSVVQ